MNKTLVVSIILVIGVFPVTANALIPETCIYVDKTVEPTLSMVGDEVLYTIDICNCGDFDITITDILDSLLGPITIPTECESLVIGECCTITIPYTIQPDDPDLLENEVCVTAVDDSGETVSDCSTATVGVVHPKIEIEKTVDKTDPWYGYTVTYGIFIENIGDWPLDIIVMDSLLGDILHPFVLFPDETWYEEFPYVVQEDAPYPLENCAEVLCIPLGLPDLIVDEDCVEIYPEPPGGEGCVPGFWKKNADNHGASAWCDRFSPSDPFSTHFSLNEPLEIRGTGKSTITNPVLLQALEANGGGVNAMIRHGVAAMLNACSDCVNYEISDTDQVIMMIEDTLNGVPGAYTIDELHSMFAEWNEAGCSVDQHGDCVD